MKEFSLEFDVDREIASLFKGLGEIDFDFPEGKKISEDSEAMPIFDSIGRKVSETLRLNWDETRGYALKRSKLTGPGWKLYKSAFKKDFSNGLLLDYAIYQAPVLALSVGLQLIPQMAPITLNLLPAAAYFAAAYPVFHGMLYARTCLNPSMMNLRFCKGISIPVCRKEDMESSYGHEGTHLLSQMYGKGKDEIRKSEGLAHKVQFLILDRLREESGKSYYLFLKEDKRLQLATDLFLLEAVKKGETLQQAADGYESLTSVGKWAGNPNFKASYDIIRGFVKSKDPFSKILAKSYSGIFHGQGYYKMRELEEKYGDEVYLDVFNGKMDEFFKGKV